MAQLPNKKNNRLQRLKDFLLKPRDMEDGLGMLAGIFTITLFLVAVTILSKRMVAFIIANGVIALFKEIYVFVVGLALISIVFIVTIYVLGQLLRVVANISTNTWKIVKEKRDKHR